MIECLCVFYFMDESGNNYALPHFFRGQDRSTVDDLVQRFETGIMEYYTLTYTDSPICSSEGGLLSAVVEHKIENIMEGQLCWASLQEWKFKDINPGPQSSFEEILTLVPLEEDDMNSGREIASGSERKIPVRIIEAVSGHSKYELVIIKVVR